MQDKYSQLGAERTLSMLQPRVAGLRAHIQELQEELWQCTRDIAGEITRACASAEEAHREAEEEKEHARKLQVRTLVWNRRDVVRWRKRKSMRASCR